ncbi:probable RNA-binding protein 18 [Impatiens glandulifera]|uniref:probable RNA-binding protein 18 n=1 Tax=Impatiens glandulifera TaxID=253017 RepID=UPI001FB14565|nr:probable RNA-binding protein 18 [Impatiens glandulifera]
MDASGFVEEKSECRLYIGNLDYKISEATLIKMFSPFGKIVAEDFLLHTRGPKRGEPRGFAFIQFSNREEAKLAKVKMNGRLVCGRPLIVRLESEKHQAEMTHNSGAVFGCENGSGLGGSSSGQVSRSAKIAAIKNKLKTMEGESESVKKKQKQSQMTCSSLDSLAPS